MLLFLTARCIVYRNAESNSVSLSDALAIMVLISCILSSSRMQNPLAVELKTASACPSVPLGSQDVQPFHLMLVQDLNWSNRKSNGWEIEYLIVILILFIFLTFDLSEFLKFNTFFCFVRYWSVICHEDS